jgi:hypothetical protein
MMLPALKFSLDGFELRHLLLGIIVHHFAPQHLMHGF